MTQRLPLCPDCGTTGKSIRGSFFLCRHCGAVWQEVDWELKLAREKTYMEEFEKRRGIDSLLVVGSLICDNCGKVMKHEERYCYNHKESIDDIDGSTAYKRGKRYCEKCSVDAGYLPFIENVRGIIDHVMMEGKGVRSVKVASHIQITCSACGQPLAIIGWNHAHNPNSSIITCDNVSCERYRNPVSYL